VCLFNATAPARACIVVASLFCKSLETYDTEATPLLQPYLLNRNDREVPDDTDMSSIEKIKSVIRRDSTQRRQSLGPTDQQEVAQQPIPYSSTMDAANRAEANRSTMYPQQTYRNDREWHSEVEVSGVDKIRSVIRRESMQRRQSIGPAGQQEEAPQQTPESNITDAANRPGANRSARYPQRMYREMEYR